MKPLIVILAYNRPAALRRLLNSIASAKLDDGVDLIISMDHGATPEVMDMASDFSLSGINVSSVRRERRLGIKAHVMLCADYVMDHDSIIMLEDDISVDPFFYQYAKQALDFYQHDTRCAGISLYAYEFNEISNDVFRPMRNGFDTYPMQLACSWGQCWTRRQWMEYRDWHEKNSRLMRDHHPGLPDIISKWPESSWKKYFQLYLVLTGRHIIYPYSSFSTNNADEGGFHQVRRTTIHQVCMQLPQRDFVPLRPSPIGHKSVSYDSYMEPNGSFVHEALGMGEDSVEIDMNGLKPLDLLRLKKYSVTTKKSRVVLRSYEKLMKPAEMNLMHPGPCSEDADFVLTESVDIMASRREYLLWRLEKACRKIFGRFKSSPRRKTT